MNFVLKENIPYIGSHTDKQCLDLYIPKSYDENIPIAVYVHGGAWRSSDRSEYPYIGSYFAERSIITAVVGYRLSSKLDPTSRHPIHVQDVAEALKFLTHSEVIQSLLSFRPTKFCLIGHSAGAQITGLLALQKKWLGKVLWKCVVGVIGVEGIYDIPTMIASYPSYSDFVELAFGSEKDDWIDGSPALSQIDLDESIPPPYLIIHSLEDELLNLEQSNIYHTRLETLGGSVEFVSENWDKHFEVLKTTHFLETCSKFIFSKKN